MSVIIIIISGEVDSDPEVDLRPTLQREWRSVHRRCISLQFLFFAQLALGNLYITSTNLTSLAVRDDGWFFAAFCSIFGLRPVGRRVPAFCGGFGALDGQQLLVVEGSLANWFVQLCWSR